MGRPREHDETTRQELLAAAEKLLAERGLAALSVREAADAIGTTTRAIYSVFGGRPGLLAALYVRGFEVLGGLIDALPQTRDPKADLVDAGVLGFRRFAVEHPNLFRLTCERMAPDWEPGPTEHAAAMQTFDKLRALVRRCKDAGLIGGRSTAEIAFQFHAFAQGLASVELQGWLPDLDGEAFCRSGLERFVTGLVAVKRK
ncbi:MAG TPA: TetR/AcrR family transcriptional regulator [Kofleriaceae bacterium]|nr:TetR/AcrR family transcriptional regulator [Kofleriaceae bacterium]